MFDMSRVTPHPDGDTNRRYRARGFHADASGRFGGATDAPDRNIHSTLIVVYRNVGTNAQSA
jgi:hypothetical protein